jgi:DNA-binding transcriptional regulator YhcF (GntR family)
MQQALKTDELVSLRELARRTGISCITLAQMRDFDGMPVYQLTRRKQLVVMREFWDWFRAHKVKPQPTDRNIYHLR